MNTTGMPGCCTAFVLHDFWGAKASEIHDYVDQLTRSTRKPNVSSHGCGSQPMNRSAAIVATTTVGQTEANKGLRLAGFKRTQKMNKPAHPENELYLWHKKIHEKE